MYSEKENLMKIILNIILLLSVTNVLAQFDNPRNNSVRIEAAENDVPSPTGFELPAVKTPSLSNSENKFNPKESPTLGEEKQEAFDMTKKDGFIDVKTNKSPKYFTKDKAIEDKYGRDQSFGELKTDAAFVNVVYRDHEYVDGDRIRVLINDDIVQSDISLDGTFRGFDLPLQPGVNRIDFVALNQGSSGPNTAELHVYDDKGALISAHEWNLLTGNKASITIVKN
jgi:hypothetical protein